MALALWEPPLHVVRRRERRARAPRGVAKCADLLADLVGEGVRTLAFVRSRRGVETVALTAADCSPRSTPRCPDQVPATAAATSRRSDATSSRRCASGRLLGLAATNALELGIDISGLDAVLLAGFPGTRAALWQQVGRAGRSAGDALAVLVARDDPLDTYLVTHPEALLDQPVEATVFDPDNPYVLGPHLCAAAQEVPLRDGDLDLFGPGTRALVDALTESGRLRRSAPRVVLDRPRAGASDLTDIRSGGGRPGPAGRGRRPAGWSARSTPRAPTAPPTPGPSTCTGARPGWSSRSTSTSRWR